MQKYPRDTRVFFIFHGRSFMTVFLRKDAKFSYSVSESSRGERHHFKPVTVIFLPVRRMNMFEGIHPVSRAEIKIAAAFRHSVLGRIDLENYRFPRSAEQLESAFPESAAPHIWHNAEMLDIYKVFALPIKYVSDERTVFAYQVEVIAFFPHYGALSIIGSLLMLRERGFVKLHCFAVSGFVRRTYPDKLHDQSYTNAVSRAISIISVKVFSLSSALRLSPLTM